MMPERSVDKPAFFPSLTHENNQPNKIVSREERWLRGKALKAEVPWDNQAYCEREKRSKDPIKLIQENDLGKLSFLLPIKYGRMAASPFGFLRGSAVLMASDLSNSPVSGIIAMLCGDAHLSNFGIFASPERRLIFDVNDFDECYPGPWEWDLKRLAVSAVLAGKEKGLEAKENRKLARRVAKKYRNAITSFAGMSALDVWYYSTAAKKFVKSFSASKKELRIMKQTLHQARTRTEEQTLESLTQINFSQRRFVDAAPLTIRLTDLLNSDFLSDAERAKVSQNDPEKAWLDYLSNLPAEKRKLLGRYHFVDTALRTVGVGSVGTYCFISLLEANSPEDTVILQQKEAGPSALERYLPPAEFLHHSERVVTGQRLLQSASDSFLGWSYGSVSAQVEYYWRQLKDMKGSIEISLLNEEGLEEYLDNCSVCLALGHARSGEPAEIAGYLDGGSAFDEAIADYSVAYAKLVECDYKELLNVIENGHLTALESID